MTTDTATLIRDGLALGLDERAVVVNALLESLHANSEGDAENAWRTEVSRRFSEVRSGEAAVVNADEHYARLRKELADRSV